MIGVLVCCMFLVRDCVMCWLGWSMFAATNWYGAIPSIDCGLVMAVICILCCNDTICGQLFDLLCGWLLWVLCVAPDLCWPDFGCRGCALCWFALDYCGIWSMVDRQNAMICWLVGLVCLGALVVVVWFDVWLVQWSFYAFICLRVFAVWHDAWLFYCLGGLSRYVWVSCIGWGIDSLVCRYTCWIL